YPCPPGASCPDFGTTIPFICPPGTFREPAIGGGTSSTISCEPCGSGTWSPWRGTPDFSSCEPCPEGRVCPVGTGNVSQGTICPEGHICGEGTTPEQQTAVRCYDGFFCKSSTTPTSVYADLCIAGFYCAEATTYVNRYKFRCPVGFYCPSGTGSKGDLKRTLLPGVVYHGKGIYYMMQKVAQFCARGVMKTKFEDVVREQQSLSKAGLPPIDLREIGEIKGSWITALDAGDCQMEAIKAVVKVNAASLTTADGATEEFAMEAAEAIQSMVFLSSQLLKKLPNDPASYANKCLMHSPLLGNAPYTDAVPEGQNISQLECLCTMEKWAEYEKCFGNGYPEISCLIEQGAKDPMCIDPSTDIRQGGGLDDFDLMADHYLTYVQNSIREEMRTQKKLDEATLSRCPYGTMTQSDGRSALSDCLKRRQVSYVQEDLEMIVMRINPVNSNVTRVTPVKSTGNLYGNEAEYWPVWGATAGSVSLVTFDVRHLPAEIRYGKHWRIKFLLKTKLEADYIDPIDCDSLLKTRTIAERDFDFISAKQRGCAELETPPAFAAEAARHAETGKPLSGGVFTFMLHPLIDCEWRVEVQIVDGVFQPDGLMFLRSAVVEYMEPERASVGTTDAFAVMISSALLLELPANLPLKSFSRGASQEVLTQAFLNWNPIRGNLANYMRNPVQNGELEYIFSEKSDYFRDSGTITLPYLPYFSNCRGFGRTIPLWAITEQTKGCKYLPPGGEISLLDLGKGAAGDSCSLTEVECLLDEIPNVKMANPRWFETQTGYKLFDMTKEPHQLSTLAELVAGLPGMTEPVYLQQGVPGKGALPKRVTVAFQYWQRGPNDKMLAAGRAWFSDFDEKPLETVLGGREKWTYELAVLYYPMSHFEVMVNFAFPSWCYFVLYGAVGGICVMIVLVLWGYHRAMSHLRYPPKLADWRHITVMVVPSVRGLLMVFAVSFVPIFLGLGFILGEIAVYRLPFAKCSENQILDTCLLGIFDWVQSSYSGETAVSMTSYGARRAGRAGVMLTVIGAYGIAASLKLLVPVSESGYYQREDKSGNAAIKNLINQENIESENKDDIMGEVSEASHSEKGDEKDKVEEMPPIFTTHLWKRSSLALLVYGNAILQVTIMRCAFSDMYKQNILFFLFALFGVRILIKVISTHFMCELMLVVSIGVTNQTMAVFTLLAAPTLFDFLIMYVALVGLQMIERLYVGPNEDEVMGKLSMVKRTLDRYIATMKKNSNKGGNDLDADISDDDENNIDDEHDLPELEGENEEMITFLMTVTADSAATFVVPIFFCVCMWLFKESAILVSFGIPIHNASFFLIFYVIMLPFQMINDKICINI
ncbi:unnamed protein product, partial [Polarella glacialis]